MSITTAAAICNGTIGLSDYGLFLNKFSRRAGPSGITNAGRDPVACEFP
jgi:hypothetical protein